MVNWVCVDISFPWSQLGERLSSVGIDASACAKAVFVDTAPCPDSGGPFGSRCWRCSCPGGQVQEGGVSGRALYEGSDRRAVWTDDEVTVVVSGNLTIVGRRGVLVDECVRAHVSPVNAFRSCPRPR